MIVYEVQTVQNGYRAIHLYSIIFHLRLNALPF